MLKVYSKERGGCQSLHRALHELWLALPQEEQELLCTNFRRTIGKAPYVSPQVYYRVFALSDAGDVVGAGDLIGYAKDKTTYHQNIVVHPDWRRMGIGRAIVRRCVKLAHEDDRLLIYTVLRSNLPSRSLIDSLRDSEKAPIEGPDNDNFLFYEM